MRVFVVAVAALIFVMSVPAQSAPSFKSAGVRSGLPAQPVAEGCGPGWHRGWCPRLGRYCCLPN